MLRQRNLSPLLLLLLITLSCTKNDGDERIEYTSLIENHEDANFNDFIEPDFPFITTTLNLSDSTLARADQNIAIRSVIIDLGNQMKFAFDTDLLRMAGFFNEKDLNLGSMPHVSYKNFGNKKNKIPWLSNPALYSTQILPGIGNEDLVLGDPRPNPPNPLEVGRGPLPPKFGKWKGLHLVNSSVILSYVAGKTDVLEMPSSSEANGLVSVHRSFDLGASPESIYFNLAYFNQLTNITLDRYQLAAETMTGKPINIKIYPEPINGKLKLIDDKHLILSMEGPSPPISFTVTYSEKDHHDSSEINIPGLDEGRQRWNHKVITRGIIDTTSSPIAVDEIKLPIDNPWSRNVRASGIDFFSDGRAAISTYDGDVWISDGFDKTLARLEWTRFASGLSEPMSLIIKDDEIYTYGRDGIINPRDTNGDGEADFYKSYSLWPAASIESRAFPLDMHPHPDDGFVLATGSASNAGPKTSPSLGNGFRAGGFHDGTVTHVFSEGDSVKIVASGLRTPFIGVHPKTALITASDQQGNSVPSTPIYEIRDGGYYGVPAMNKGKSDQAENPITWIPHTYDRSAVSQEWALSTKLGPLNNQLISLSYGEPAIYRIHRDDRYEGQQGGVFRLPATFPAPILKAAINPKDELMYFAGFRIWDSNSPTISSLSRIRVVDTDLNLADSFSIDQRGVLISFPQKIDPESANKESISISQWDYIRTDNYGSPRVNPRNATTQDVQVSEDGMSIFASLSNFDNAWQTEISYSLKSVDGDSISNIFYGSAFERRQLDLRDFEFPGDIQSYATTQEASTDQAATSEQSPPVFIADGEVILKKFGCQVCHSLDGSTEGRTGPSFKGLIGSTRNFTDGTSAVADRAYIKTSIFEPSKQVVDGYSVGMASYKGIISDTEAISIFKYLRDLK